MNMKDFWVGRMFLVTCSISNQKHPCYFQNKHQHFQNTFQTRDICKRSTLCIHSYERESLQSLPKRWCLFKILSKTTQSTFSNKSKWSNKQLRSHGKPWMERVITPSLFIIYPQTQETISKVFMFLFSLSFWIKEKSMTTLANRKNWNQTQKIPS